MTHPISKRLPATSVSFPLLMTRESYIMRRLWYISVSFSTTSEEQRKHEETSEGWSTTVQLNEARKLGKIFGLTILITSIILLLYTEAVGWGFQHPATAPGFLWFTADGLFVAGMSSWRVILDPENAARKAALVGYDASEKVKKKYAERASKLLLLLLVLLPVYSMFLVIYTYYVVDPVGVTKIFSNIGITSDYAYSMGFGFLPFLCIFLFVFCGCLYLRDSELRRFMWRVYGWGGRKTRKYKPEKPKSGK